MVGRVAGVVVMVIAGLVLATAGARAVDPSEMLADPNADPNLETRARDLSAGLRCLVCQNQSIDDSDAPLAKDLRTLVRERLTAGDSDQQVRDFLVARYGEFVLLKPPFNWHTFALWLMPAVLLLAALGIVGRRLLRAPAARTAAALELSAAEKSRLDQLLAETDQTRRSP